MQYAIIIHANVRQWSSPKFDQPNLHLESVSNQWHQTIVANGKSQQ